MSALTQLGIRDRAIIGDRKIVPAQTILEENFYSYFELTPNCTWDFIEQNWYEQDTSPILAASRGRPIGVWRWSNVFFNWQWYVTDGWRGQECMRR